MAQTKYKLGDMTGAEQLAQALVLEARKSHYVISEVVALALLGDIRLAQGFVLQAQRYYLNALDLSPRASSMSMTLKLLSCLIKTYLEQGSLEAAHHLYQFCKRPENTSRMYASDRRILEEIVSPKESLAVTFKEDLAAQQESHEWQAMQVHEAVRFISAHNYSELTSLDSQFAI